MTELRHHGILGMKWGIRRYQNPDGTWTEAGKKRYSNAIKRDLKKQNAKAYREWSKHGIGDKASTEKLYSNQRAVRNKIVEEFGKTKEWDAYLKADHDYIKAEEEHFWRQDNDPKYDSDVGLYNLQMKGDLLRKSLKAYTAKQDEILNTYMNEYMGAKLKDIGHEDTAVGREIVKSLIANNNDDRWWYSDYNYIDHGKKG